MIYIHLYLFYSITPPSPTPNGVGWGRTSCHTLQVGQGWELHNLLPCPVALFPYLHLTAIVFSAYKAGFKDSWDVNNNFNVLFFCCTLIVKLHNMFVLVSCGAHQFTAHSTPRRRESKETPGSMEDRTMIHFEGGS